MAVINEGEPGAFFICTETSPRCYIIQRVNASSVDRMLDDLVVSSGEFDTPPTPVLPWWFTPECENQLLSATEHAMPIPYSIPAPLHFPIAVNPLAPIQFHQRPLVPSNVPQSPEMIKQQLKAQLEYYFSRENLMTDRFLRSQMDNDQYVPIRIIAGFPKVKRLTNDYNLVVKVLRESPHVQVDEKGERVRAVSKRCTIILREIPETTDEREVASMFDGGPPYLSLRYGLNNSWYVTFESEEATQRAFLHLQSLRKTFNNKPICARIKTGGAPYSEPLIVPERSPSAVPSEAPADPVITAPLPPAVSPSSSDSFDLGQILASYGYVPRATYKPGATVVHVTNPNNMRSQVPSQRVRGTGNAHQGTRNNANNRGRGGFIYNQRIYTAGNRDSNGSYNYHQMNARRNVGSTNLDAHRDGYRDRNNEMNYRGRGRMNRQNNSSQGQIRSGTPADPQKNGYNDVRQRTYDTDQNIRKNLQSKSTQFQQRNRREYLSTDHSSYRGSLMAHPVIYAADEGNRDSERTDLKALNGENGKQEAGSRKFESPEYNFEEGQFPSLYDGIVEQKEPEIEEPEEKPSFSSVAAGRRKEKKEPKERKSYAQTLKQNNGFANSETSEGRTLCQEGKKG